MPGRKSAHHFAVSSTRSGIGSSGGSCPAERFPHSRMIIRAKNPLVSIRSESAS